MKILCNIFYFIFKAAVSALLAVSVLLKKYLNKYHVIFQKSYTSNSFSYDMPATLVSNFQYLLLRQSFDILGQLQGIRVP